MGVRSSQPFPDLRQHLPFLIDSKGCKVINDSNISTYYDTNLCLLFETGSFINNFLCPHLTMGYLILFLFAQISITGLISAAAIHMRPSAQQRDLG
jgi:hypothetical protein